MASQLTEPQMAIQLPKLQSVSMKRFREAVETIEPLSTRVKIEVGYLMAARASEILNKTTPWDFLHNLSKPYGNFMKVSFQDFEMTPDENPALKEKLHQKALVITLAVAKRGKRITEKKKEKEETSPAELIPQEVEQALTFYGQTELYERWKKGQVTIDPLLIEALKGRIHFRAVALPTSTIYEPWVLDLLTYMKETGKEMLSFNFTRERLRQIYRENLKGILPPPNKRNLKNLLRHYRIDHLINYYSFNPSQTTNYCGWTFRYAFQQQGIEGSPNIDYYLTWAWKSYFYQLLKPISMMK